jgi:DUF4097 and DUF4098 domain-containing protein YvlB
MPERTFSAPTGQTPPEIEVRNPAGTVTVEARDGADQIEVWVEALDSAAEDVLDEVEISADAGSPDRPDAPVRLRVLVPQRRLFRSASFAVTVTTPPGARVRVSAMSADVDVRGAMGRVELTGASGDLTLGSSTEAHVRSASGDIRVDSVSGRATIASASGDVRIGSASGGVHGRTASGDIEVDECVGDMSLTTASGDLTVGLISGGSVKVTSVSGDATIGVVPGLRVWLDLSSVSGSMDSTLDGDAAGGDEGPADLSITMRSVSGDLRVHRAAGAAAA